MDGHHDKAKSEDLLKEFKDAYMGEDEIELEPLIPMAFYKTLRYALDHVEEPTPLPLD